MRRENPETTARRFARNELRGLARLVDTIEHYASERSYIHLTSHLTKRGREVIIGIFHNRWGIGNTLLGYSPIDELAQLSRRLKGLNPRHLRYLNYVASKIAQQLRDYPQNT